MLTSFISAARRRRETTETALALLEGRDKEVRIALDEAETTLRMAAATVAALTAERDDIQKQCKVLNATLQSLPSTFDPRVLQRMPVELLRAIFQELALEPDALWPIVTEDGEEAFYNFLRAAAPFRIAAVCRRWRTIAIETPDIWTYVALPLLKHPPPSTLIRYRTHIERLLQRSRSCPIDVLLEWQSGATGSRWGDPHLEVYRDILSSVAGHVSRWSHVMLSLPPGVSADAVEFLRSPMPMLLEISLAISNSDMLPWDDFPNYLPQCPRLTGIYISAVFLYPRSPMVSLVDAIITVSDQPTEAIWHSLAMMPALRKLEILFTVPDDLTLPPDPPTSQLRLPSLQSLSLQGYILGSDSWATQLELPQLSSIILPVGFSAHAGALLQAACAAATRATIVDEAARYDLDGTTLDLPDMQALEVLAGLRHLTLRKATLGPSFCERLRGAVWPQLESVTLSSVLFSPLAAERFVELVRARASGSERFRVTMRGPSRPFWVQAQLSAILKERFVAEAGADGLPGPNLSAAVEEAGVLGVDITSEA